jgi:hypothetical protein
VSGCSGQPPFSYNIQPLSQKSTVCGKKAEKKREAAFLNGQDNKKSEFFHPEKLFYI